MLKEKRSYLVRIENKKTSQFIGYNVCETLKDAKRYCKIMNKNFKTNYTIR